MRIALVAGEASGDALGAALIEALRNKFPQAQFAGVAGPKMKAAGCVAWHGIEELSVMGLTEVLSSLPRLWRLRSGLRKRILEWRPDVFIGVDFKEFNLGLAKLLKRAGLPTVQYVSPQVWAWRQGRVRTIGEAVDLVLCLFPFEPDFYREHGVRAAFVGHPLADQIPLVVDSAAARAELGIDPAARVLAILPGSRRGEVERLAGEFAGAAELLRRNVQSAHRMPPSGCWTAMRDSPWRPPMSCWWLRARPRSKPRCANARWWSLTSSARSPHSCSSS
jgi:lipid-A-disaccharide synthase